MRTSIRLAAKDTNCRSRCEPDGLGSAKKQPVRCKHPARYFLVESAKGVGSRFRMSRFPCGRSLAENDSRPGVFDSSGFPQIFDLLASTFLFRCWRKDPPRLPGESSQANWPRSEAQLPTTRRSSPLAGREFSGWAAKRGTKTRRTWPVSLTISPASGEDFQAAARRETGTKTGSDQLALTRTN
jgi:hypothetical protein